MAKFMLNICYGDAAKREQSSNPSDDKFLMEKYNEWSDKMGEKIVVAHKLKDKVGRRLDLNGKIIKDGPYIETKESLGGFYIIEAKDYEEACLAAKDCPTLLYQGGYVEVREVEF